MEENTPLQVITITKGESNTNDFTCSNLKIGEIKQGILSKNAKAMWDDREMIFENNRFFGLDAIIKDGHSHQEISKISLPFMKTSTTFTVDGKEYTWKNGSYIYKRWHVEHEGKTISTFNVKNRKKMIDTNDPSNEVNLIGTYLMTCYEISIYALALIIFVIAYFIGFKLGYSLVQ